MCLIYCPIKRRVPVSIPVDHEVRYYIYRIRVMEFSSPLLPVKRKTQDDCTVKKSLAGPCGFFEYLTYQQRQKDISTILELVNVSHQWSTFLRYQVCEMHIVKGFSRPLANEIWTPFCSSTFLLTFLCADVQQGDPASYSDKVLAYSSLADPTGQRFRVHGSAKSLS